MTKKFYTRIGAGVFVLAMSMGHGAGGCCSGEEVLGPRTEAACPPDSTLTYDNFGKPFMESYCTKCHASTLSGDDRQGATAFHDFDTVVGVRSVIEHVDQTAAAGPAATNESMPPEGPYPSMFEREQLGEWLACGAPE